MPPPLGPSGKPLYNPPPPPAAQPAPAAEAAPPPSGPTLVTGATGFVGSAVARALEKHGHRLRLLVRRGSDRRNIHGVDAELVEGDLKDPASLAAAVAGCRYVVHVAADYRLWVPDPAPMMAANVEGTRTLLLAARDAGVERIVYCSSVAALGLVGDGTPGTEDTPVKAGAVIGVYKQSKYQAEQAVRVLAADGVPVVIVNPTAPVGPRDIKPTPTGKMVREAAAGLMPAYVDTGLNIVHVDDVAEGHVLALERGRPGEAYILGGEDMGMAHLLALVDDVVGRAPRAPRQAAHWDALPRRLDGREARPLLRAGAARVARDAEDGGEANVLLLRQGAGRAGLRRPARPRRGCGRGGVVPGEQDAGLRSLFLFSFREKVGMGAPPPCFPRRAALPSLLPLGKGRGGGLAAPSMALCSAARPSSQPSPKGRRSRSAPHAVGLLPKGAGDARA